VVLSGIVQHRWPQSNMDCLGPAGECIEQLLARALQQIGDGLLSSAIMEVHVYTTKGKFLLRIMTCLLKGAVVELPIVAVVVIDFYSVLGRVLLEGKQCLPKKLLI
jgi:hypothetical protein